MAAELEETSSELTKFEVRVRPVDPEEGDGFEAIVPQFSRSAVGYGETQEEAVQELRYSVQSLLDVYSKSGKSIPKPVPIRPWLEYSGKMTVRMPKSLHYKLDMLAEEEGVSLNQLVVNLLSAGAEYRHIALPDYGANFNSEMVELALRLQRSKTGAGAHIASNFFQGNTSDSGLRTCVTNGSPA